MSNFVRLTPSGTQATDRHDIRDLVVNRQYISHLVRRSDYTVVHFANGDRTVNVQESPTDILFMPTLRATAENDGPAEVLAGDV
jgi:hypothetical protein